MACRHGLRLRLDAGRLAPPLTAVTQPPTCLAGLFRRSLGEGESLWGVGGHVTP